MLLFRHISFQYLPIFQVITWSQRKCSPTRRHQYDMRFGAGSHMSLLNYWYIDGYQINYPHKGGIKYRLSDKHEHTDKHSGYWKRFKSIPERTYVIPASSVSLYVLNDYSNTNRYPDAGKFVISWHCVNELVWVCECV